MACRARSNTTPRFCFFIGPLLSNSSKSECISHDTCGPENWNERVPDCLKPSGEVIPKYQQPGVIQEKESEYNEYGRDLSGTFRSVVDAYGHEQQADG